MKLTLAVEGEVASVHEVDLVEVTADGGIEIDGLTPAALKHLVGKRLAIEAEGMKATGEVVSVTARLGKVVVEMAGEDT